MSRSPSSLPDYAMDLANASEQWEWEDGGYQLAGDSPFEPMASGLWNGFNPSNEDSLYMFDEATPIKGSTSMEYPVCPDHNQGSLSKGMEVCRESSQSKRRRVLQFNSPEKGHCPDQSSPACVDSKMQVSINVQDGENSSMERGVDLHTMEQLGAESYWASSVSEERCNSGCDKMDCSSEGWVTKCFTDSEMQINVDDLNIDGTPEDEIDVSEFCTIPPEMETDTWQEPLPPAPRVIIGKKKILRTPRKLATPVAYPFALIKPCGVQGDVTLKDINQRILTPRQSRLKHMKDDASPSYPTSAFSGKPVVALTKIHTEGGKGSITIMRTKG
ncbi:protein XRI1 isoform X1 [Amborella trichopoda]|uniref:protein XRI1 isoform X1 n=1 Tax=Amborella trichopoda TaxID=13333 RepID=UPI0005D326E2|nr:protein XRI1 isoform X1 [Amborella trichopoda]|eukprot:XP_011622067.1 protein XRI1 isoform X1 [Amborella trichopoda]